jgi:hypothetical protein
MKTTGFTDITYRDITAETAHSSRRLYRIYFLAKIYVAWMKLTGHKPSTDMQKKNIDACKYQYLSRRKGLSGYGLVVGIKP